MTEAVLLTGKRGTGKSLSAVQTIHKYVKEGRTVATNLNLFMEYLVPAWSKAVTYRLPDVPTAELFSNPHFPVGNPNPIDEEKNGLIVLDECAAFMNSRDWKDKGRTDLIAWLAQSRKYGWDLLLIAQHPRMIDAQVRDALCDVHGTCKVTDKIGIPFVTWFFRYFFGVKVMMPKFHVVTYFYGFAPSSPKSFTDVFRNVEVKNGYDTLQKISAEFGQQGMSCNLSHWHLEGRYMSRLQMFGRIAAVSLVVGLVLGVASGFFGRGLLVHPVAAPVVAALVAPVADESVKVNGVMRDGDVFTLVLSDGRIEHSTEFRQDVNGTLYRVGKRWYAEAR